MASANDALSAMVGLGGDMDSSLDDGSSESNAAGATTTAFMRFEDEETDGDSTLDESYYGMSKQEMEKSKKIARIMKNLRYDNPGASAAIGKMAESPQTEHVIRRSRRARTARSTNYNEMISLAPAARRYYHDKLGNFCSPNDQPVQLCDCLRDGCEGCHWPCEKCGGRRCAFICQKRRTEYITRVENQTYKKKMDAVNPFVQK